MIRSYSFHKLVVLTLSAALASCMSSEPRMLIPSITLSPELVSLTGAEPVASGLNFGMTTSVNESDSLSNVAILPGVRVRSVTPSGAADLAGIRSGDIILEIDGREVNQPDAIDALAQQIDTAQTFTFQVRRNTTVFAATVNARPINDQRTPPVELYRIDPVATRAGFTTEVYQDQKGQTQSGARVVQIFSESPFPAADIRTGDTIMAVNGQAVQSAQGFVSRIHNEFVLGEKIDLTLLRAAGMQTQVLEKDITLWDPGRRVNRVSLGPLFQYESTLNPQQTKVSVLDLWLFSLFSYEHAEGEKEYSFLSLFRFATGYGELLEEQ